VRTRAHVPFKVRNPNRTVYAWQDPVRWKAEFESDATNPRSWQEEAQGLACAPNTLMWIVSEDPRAHDFNTSPYLRIKSILFLYAAATENLVKAVWIARGGAPLAHGVLTKDLSTHNLRRLARQAGITLSTSDDGLLSLVQQLIESGKYPISKSSEQQLRLPGFGLRSCAASILALLQRLEDELAATVRPPQKCRPVDYAALGTPKGKALLRETQRRGRPGGSKD
jgi:hypothetical protein